MIDPTKNFGEGAVKLARNPLGIIALFLVMIYGFASLVTVAGSSLTTEERLPLIYFLVAFPVLVLGVFAWLVSKHSSKLYGPADMGQDNYLILQLETNAMIALRTAETSKGNEPPSGTKLQEAVEAARALALTAATSSGEAWQNHVLWVDDRPDNNTYERKAFESVGLYFSLAESTDEALKLLSETKFAAIISDMGRREGAREGYVLLDRIRNQGDRTPLFFYAASNAPEHVKETFQHGGQGCTNNANDLFTMVTRAIIGGRS